MNLGNYECEGQLTIFDILLPGFPSNDNEQPDICNIDQLIEECVLHGTGFVDGKKRVYQLYKRNELNASDRAQAIKKEYGLGGAGWPLRGYGLHGYDTFSGKGIKLEYRDSLGEHEEIISWKQIELAIHKLINLGKYYTPT